jgi:hypothetical protein
MSPKASARPKPTRSSVLAGPEPWAEGNEASANDDDVNADGANDDGADADAERPAEHERRAEQADGAAEQGGQGDEPRSDAAELDPQLERAEGEGMVTEHAKVSATDPGPEPLPEPEPEPEPDHGPGDREWDPQDEPD